MGEKLRVDRFGWKTHDRLMRNQWRRGYWRPGKKRWEWGETEEKDSEGESGNKLIHLKPLTLKGGRLLCLRVGGKSEFGLTSVQRWELENVQSSTKPLYYLEASGCLSVQSLKVWSHCPSRGWAKVFTVSLTLSSRFFRVLVFYCNIQDMPRGEEFSWGNG